MVRPLRELINQIFNVPAIRSEQIYIFRSYAIHFFQGFFYKAGSENLYR